MTGIAKIKYKLSAHLQYEQYYAEIEEKLPIFEQNVRSKSSFRVILKIGSDFGEM